MKKLAIILTIVAATAMIFSSCGKYEEGPAFSLLTKKARITGTWTITEMSTDGTIIDLQGTVMKQTLEKDGTGTFTASGEYLGMTISTTSNLEWRFDDTKENIEVRIADEDGNFDDDWDSSKIIKLTNSECWVEDTETENDITYTTITKLTKE